MTTNFCAATAVPPSPSAALPARGLPVREETGSNYSDEVRAMRMAIADAERAIDVGWALDIDTTKLRRLRSAAQDALAVLEG